MTIPLSTLPAPVRDRLRALAPEWLGFDPWDCHDSDGGRYGAWESRVPGTRYGVENCLPLHIDAGFDLGVRLVADAKRIKPSIVHRYIDDDTAWDVAGYGPATTPTEKLAALVRRLT